MQIGASRVAAARVIEGAPLARVNAASDFVPFATLFTVEEGRRGVVVTFLALLELLREGLLDLVQSESFAPIYVRVPEAQAAGQTT